MAARIVSSFNNWKRYDDGRQALQREQLERIRNSEGLTKGVFEIVSRALGD
ncbi:MAG: aminopeptidase N C-terminal domain-containing protein [Planctomycetota bacterium]